MIAAGSSLQRGRRICPAQGSALAAALSIALAAGAAAQDAGPIAGAPSPPAPLADESRRIAESVPDEGTPAPDEHYPVSNEWRHDLWFPHLRDLGGAFVGVGSDQCYTLAAVQNAEMVWLIDFDPLVPLVHRMYAVLLAESPDPASLVARFASDRTGETRALLAARLEGTPDRDRIVRAFVRWQPRWSRYLVRVSRLRQEGQATSWLSDPRLYARVRTLFATGRVVARNGDVTGARTLRGIGEAARRLGIPVRAFYLSNAEQFFDYTPSFLENVRALPVDERSVVLRTFRDRHATYPRGDRWHYVVHRFADFADRLERGGYRHSRQIVADLVGGRRPPLGPEGLTIVDDRTPRLFGPTARR